MMILINCEDRMPEIGYPAPVRLRCGVPNDPTSRSTVEPGSGWRWLAKLAFGVFAGILLLASVPGVAANFADTSVEIANGDPVTAVEEKDKAVIELDTPAAMKPAPNPHQAKLLAMPEKTRLVLLRKVVQSSGAKCSKVERTFYQGADPRENHIWNVACAQGGSFSITLYNDVKGSTGVVDCGVLLAVTGLACFEPFSK